MVQRGKDHLGATCVVAAHLAERAWTVMDRGTPYVVCDTDGTPVTGAQAKAIIASLKKGGKFEDIAKKQSKDPGSGANGGDLDWATAVSYVPEFAEAMVKLKKGETSPAPVKSQFGWHVIRVDDIRDAKLPKLEEIRPQIAQQLQQQKLAQFQDGLRKNAKVE